LFSFGSYLTRSNFIEAAMLNQLPVPLMGAKIQGLSAATGAVVAFGVLMEAGAADSAFAKGSAANVAACLLVVSAFHYVASWQCQGGRLHLRRRT